MPNFRRNFLEGGTFFFTLITARRMRLFEDAKARKILGKTFRYEQTRRPFHMEGIVLLPDHLHAIWTLPPGDADFDIRWSSIKGNFTRDWLAAGGIEVDVTKAQASEGRRGVWQPRFVEHTLRDERDFETHLDYIHYNPVKHGLVSCPQDWSASSIHLHIERGWYPANWACAENHSPLEFPTLDEDFLEGFSRTKNR